ncbi:MAG: ATPase [Bacteroidales bacterium]|jgi:N-acetylglucosamine kinase-like BadF-type ATPase|nr:ATPase [Bacteroidales bacterium]
MILVADGGSTKTEWRTIEDGKSGTSIFSAGINPYFLTAGEIEKLVGKDLESFSGKNFTGIWFYGTGCNSEAKNTKVRSALDALFQCSEIFVGSDLLGAARSLCQNKPGIACIMGTGSNSCYYNGNDIVANVSPLGYILGDEGGGAVLGKKLLSAVLKKQVPDNVRKVFFDTYKMSTADILDSVYMKPFPNRFLGQFARFLSANIQFPELHEIVTSSFDEFIRRNVLQYPESKDYAVNFTGSIAFHFRSFLESCLSKHGLKAGKITLSPVEDLIRYHTSHINK